MYTYLWDDSNLISLDNGNHYSLIQFIDKCRIKNMYVRAIETNISFTMIIIEDGQ